MKAKIAIVCDWLVSRGGAERVIKVIAEMFPNAPIYTSLFNRFTLPEFSSHTVITSPLQTMPLALKRHYMYLPLMPYVFEQFDLSAYDIVISSAHSCAKGVITKPETFHICYCHSPMRYLWDNCHEYFEQFRIPRLLKSTARRMLHGLRLWDRAAADRVDAYIANSKHVQKRIWKYYRRESDVIYPPLDIEKFSPIPGRCPAGYFLAVGRLTPYKQFNLLVDVFNELQLPLIIVGKGRDEVLLKKKASRFVTMLGYVTDEELRSLYNGCIALMFPHEEDFGIIPLEAMSCGRPVIALAKGGALETLVPGKTGLFFNEQSRDALKRAIIEARAIKWDSQTIRAQVERFSRPMFEKRFIEVIEEKWHMHRYS